MVKSKSDNTKFVAGGGDDLQIYHDGTNSNILNTAGELVVRDDSRIRIRTDQLVINSGDNSENILYGAKDGGVELYFNNAKKFETTSAGVTITGTLSVDNVSLSDSLSFGDTKKLKFGADEDLRIFHDHNTPQNIINSFTAMPLVIMSNGNTSIKSNNGDNMGVFKKDGAVELYFDNNKRFETNLTGAEVTGLLEVSSGVTVTGNLAVGSVSNFTIGGTALTSTSGILGGSLAGTLGAVTMAYLPAAPSSPVQGQFYFNSLSSKAQIYTGSSFVDLVPSGGGGGGGGGGGSFTWGGDRGLVAGGQSTGSNVIQYYDITTPGNAQDFGDLNYAPTRTAGLSSGTRAVIGGGFNGFTTYYNTMDYITVATTGNAQDLGDLSQARSSLAGASDATTGIFAGGGSNTVNFYLDTIDSFTIATTGNASDFGNLTQGRSLIAGWNNSTRAVFAGGDPDGATQSNVIDYITIASAGDAVDFGDMTDTWNRASGAGDATYALFAGGRRAGSGNANGWTENIDRITVATTGNATDFGDLSRFKDNTAGNSNGTRATFSGGSTNTGSNVTLDVIDYVTVATPGNASDFGDLLAVNESAAATSGGAGGGGGGSSFWGGDRGIYLGGYYGARLTTISYLNMTTTGNTADFGDLTKGRNNLCAASNGTRVFAVGGQTGNTAETDDNNRLDYITTATLGNATDAGNLDYYTYGATAAGNTTRSIIFGGYQYNSSSRVDTIQYFDPANPAGTTDFGDIASGHSRYGAACSSATRALTGGCDAASNMPEDRIEYVTIDTPSNSTSFGDLYTNIFELSATSDETRGLWLGGLENSSIPPTDRIQYVTMDTTGNATDFGNLTDNDYARYTNRATSNNTRGLIFGVGSDALSNEYVTIQTPGNATDLSDVTDTNHLYGSAGSGSAS